jgi:hypothetical protein
MNNAMRKRRRQVAWACFEPHLPEEQRLKAIQILEHGFQIDGVSNLIAYITRICSEFGIGSETCKLLFNQFYKMMMDESAGFLADPLPSSHPQEPQHPAEKSPAAPGPIVAPIPATAEPVRKVSIHAWMFAHFMQQLLGYLPQPTDFFTTLAELAADKKVAKTIGMHINGWLNDADDFGWAGALSEQQLADIVHLAYTALCEALGPIAADDVFHKSLAKCEQRPEAREFSPSRFL